METEKHEDEHMTRRQRNSRKAKAGVKTPYHCFHSKTQYTSMGINGIWKTTRVCFAILLTKSGSTPPYFFIPLECISKFVTCSSRPRCDLGPGAGKAEPSRSSPSTGGGRARGCPCRAPFFFIEFFKVTWENRKEVS